MANLTAADPLKVKGLTSPEEVREQLLRPFPKLNPRALLILAVILAILAWSFSAVGPSEINRITSFWDPFQAMGNLLLRMTPPEWEVVNSQPFNLTLFGQEIINFEITKSVIEIPTFEWRGREIGGSMELGWLPVISALFETIQMAIVGTLGAIIMALPFSLFAARNTSPHPVFYNVSRFILNFLRSIPELVYALIFVAGVGLGPFTGVLALAFGSVGSLARVFAEAIEQIDPSQVNAVRATGADGLQTFIYAVLPQAVPLFISYSIIYFEANVRHATILGLVGAGGLGFLLFKYTGTSDYDKVLGTAIVLVVAVTIIDRFSSWLRLRFI
jgi:phosphonate transport system permease protein